MSEESVIKAECNSNSMVFLGHFRVIALLGTLDNNNKYKLSQNCKMCSKNYIMKVITRNGIVFEDADNLESDC